MAEFRYKARSVSGEMIKGVLEATSADTAAAQLASDGMTPIELMQAQARSASGESSWLAFIERMRAKPPNEAEIILFARQMYTLVKSGVPVVRGVRGLSESSKNPTMQKILLQVSVELESGRDLSNALAPHVNVFSSLFQSMVRVGENTGRLEEAFLRIGQYLALERDTKNRIRSALRYPAFVLISIALAIAVVNIFVIPVFAEVFEKSGVSLPLATRVLIAVSDFFVTHWPLVCLFVVGSAIGLMRYARTEKGRMLWDEVKLRIPVAGDIIRRATLGRFARAFSISVSAGVPLLQGLTIVSRALDNEYVGKRVLEMRQGVERGDTLTRTAAATGMFTPLVLQMLAVGEETGAVDDLLAEVADYYEREVDHDIANLSAAIEPMLISAVAAIVMVLALGVFLPMWDVAAGVGLKR